MRVGEKRRFSKFVDQLTSVIERDTVTQAVRTGFSHGYDSAGNRTSDNSGSYAIKAWNGVASKGRVAQIASGEK